MLIMHMHRLTCNITTIIYLHINCKALVLLCTSTLDWSSAEASPQLVLASGQGNGISGVTEVCAPRPCSKKLHVSMQKCVLQTR